MKMDSSMFYWHVTEHLRDDVRYEASENRVPGESLAKIHDAVAVPPNPQVLIDDLRSSVGELQ